MDFLELFNEVAKLAKPAVADSLPQITDSQMSLQNTGFDSLDLLLITVFMCEIYGIPEEVGKNMRPANVAEIEAFVLQHATRHPTSVEDAIESIS